MQKWETSFTGQKLHIPKWLKSNPGVRQVPFTGAQAPSSFIALLWTEWCPLEFLWWSPNLPAPHPGVTIGGVKKWLRLNEITWVGPWSHRSSVPIRGNTRELKTSVTMNLSLSLYHVRTQWELTIWKSGWRLVSQTEPHLRLNLIPPTSRVMRNTFLLFKPPSLWYWYFLMAAQQTQTSFDPVWRTLFPSLLV